MSPSLPGSVAISGLAFLENVRVPDIDKPKTVAFDALFRMSDANGPAEGAAVAHLTYYNGDNLLFTEDPTPYFIVAKIAQVEHGLCSGSDAPVQLGIPPSKLENRDYCFVGDIDTLIPATPEAAAHIGCRLHISASGIIERGQDYEKNVSFFYFTPTQYVSVYHKKFDSSFRSALPIRCVIKESSRWTSVTKPKPRSGKVVTVSGFINEIVRTAEGLVDYVEVIPDQVTYLADVPAPPAKLQNSLDSNITPKGDRKVKFPGFSGSPSPSPVPAKRPRVIPMAELDDSSMESVLNSPSPAGSSSGATITLPARPTISGPVAAAINRNKGKAAPAQASN